MQAFLSQSEKEAFAISTSSSSRLGFRHRRSRQIYFSVLMENVVAQMLRARGHKLYFYSRCDNENRENHMEIDFLIKEGKKICPVEVKSGNYRSHSSLDKFRKKFSAKIGTSFILYTKDIMEKDGILHLPLYMAMFL